MRQKNKPRKPMVVGIVDSARAGRIAEKLGPDDLDVLEWRADCLPGSREIPRSPLPWILTVRDASEGGRGGLSARERERRFLAGLPRCRFVDIELRTISRMRTVLREASAGRVAVIGSFHDFKKTPPAGRLADLAKRAADSGCDLLKVATFASTTRDVSALLDLLSGCSLPAAVMGMGRLGFASRLLFASCGSALNYGWLDRPNVPGQWGALELRQMLNR